MSLGAALGAYSHIVLDSLMHQDMVPLWPFSDENPMLGLVWLSTLHMFCLGAGILGLCIIGLRRGLQAPD